MKKSAVWFATVSVIFLLSLCVPAFAADDSPAASRYGGWTIGIPVIPDVGGYSTSGVYMKNIKGKITKLENMSGVKDGLQMRIKTKNDDNYLIWMGPKWFIENQRIKFNVGDDVEVRGRRYDSFTYVATEVSKGNMTMKLRSEEDGLPNWECCFPQKKEAED